MLVTPNFIFFSFPAPEVLETVMIALGLRLCTKQYDRRGLESK